MDVNTIEVFQSVVEHMPMGFVMYDTNHKILVTNKKTEDLFNVSRDQILNKEFSVKDKKDGNLWFLTQVLFPSVAPRMKHISEPGVYPQIVRISFDDPQLELETTTLQLTDADGNPAGFVKLIEDRTREAMIMESKHEFVSLVSHQLRTPLTAVNWTFQLLLKEQLADSQKDMLLTGARAAAELVARIDDTVEVAKIEDGRFDYKFITIDLVLLLQEITERLRLLAGQYKITITFENDVESLPLSADKHKLGVALANLIDKISKCYSADKHKLGVALANLIDNAVKYSSSGGTVTVSLRKGEEEGAPAIIAVQDAGIGIADGDKEKLFTKFFRAENARKVQPDGNGLGLFITKNVVEQHGGRLEVESTLGNGSVFTVTLPTNPNSIPALKNQAENA